MKEAVLKIIRDRIEELNESLSYGLAVTDVHQIVASKKELRKVVEAVSALPEQGYTREQKYSELIEAMELYQKALSEELSSTSALAYVHGWRSDRYEEGVKLRERIATLKAELSSLTPVAVEAERTERWISTDEQLPEVSQEVQVYLRHGTGKLGRQKIDYLLPDNPVNSWSRWFKDNYSHWRLPFDPPSDSLAPQVENK